GRAVTRIISFMVFPVALLVVFFIIYLGANNIFSDMASHLGVQLQIFFTRFFDFFSWQRGLFLLLGLLITGTVLLKSKVDYFSRREALLQDGLQRKRTTLRKRREGVFFKL